MAPALEQLASELKGKVKVVKVDVDQSPGITTKYAIRAMPTLMMFKGGEVAGPARRRDGAEEEARGLDQRLDRRLRRLSLSPRIDANSRAPPKAGLFF